MNLIQTLTQLNRRIDCGGVAKLRNIFDKLYVVGRNRPDSPVIDLIMTPRMRAYFSATMMRDISRKYGPSFAVMKPEEGELKHGLGGLAWSIFDVPEIGFRVAAIESTLLGEPAEDEMWCIDYSDIEWDGEIRHPERHIIFSNIDGIE